MNIPSISNFIEPIAYEGRCFKGYCQRRFKDITNFIKEEKRLSFFAFAEVAFCVYHFTFLIFAIPIIVACDYLDETIWLNLKIDRVSKPFYWLFYQALCKSSNIGEEIKLQDKEINQTEEELKKLSDREKAWLRKFVDKDIRGMYESLISAYKERLNQLKEYEKRPAIVFIQAKADHNGALNFDKLHYFKFKDNPNGVDDLLKKYRIVVIDNATSIAHINEQVQQISSRIEQVWILAHGYGGESMGLHEKNEINKENANLLTSELEKKLAPDANIILYSCSAGKSLKNQKNIAATISKLLPGKIVWAPQTDFNGKVIIDLNGKEMKIRFWHYRTRLEYIMKKIFYVFTFRFKTPLSGKFNATACYRNGEAYTAN